MTGHASTDCTWEERFVRAETSGLPRAHDRGHPTTSRAQDTALPVVFDSVKDDLSMSLCLQGCDGHGVLKVV